MSDTARFWAKPLLWFHLFVCIVWLLMFHMQSDLPVWMGHIILLSILLIQFTWGFTVGLIVGPSRKRRGLLWWSLLLLCIPLSVYRILIYFLLMSLSLPLALLYIGAIVAMLACETYGGVLLGVKVHSGETDL